MSSEDLPEDGLKVALFSDFHYGFPSESDMERYFDPVMENMVQEVNEFESDIVVLLGDMIEHSDRESDLAKVEKIGEMLQGLDQDVYAIPGNHDPMTVSKSEYLDKIKAENGDAFFTLEYGSRKLIFLDTVTEIDERFDTGLIGKDQRDWLESEINTEKEVLLFSHHLLHYHEDLEDNWFFYDKPELATCIDKHWVQEIIGQKPRAAFSAHIHQATLGEYQDIPYFTTTSINKFNPPDTFDQNYALVEISDKEIKFTTQDQEIIYSK